MPLYEWHRQPHALLQGSRNLVREFRLIAKYNPLENSYMPAPTDFYWKQKLEERTS